ncbi:uncharacterized protein Z518_09055 [Rhinocladiella mackenziei CBS 650.93]|uniref:Rhinocladiella mackenziei CBS 650.93 unplaced genomic scaffold supercont1.7, whole genome shotgun sequence n=1 Tax=Rhinocladiella mackenziei CBS 650.93 TaxID=1442369 RepID=A0A0D2IXK7_9EURO|nr:uncharacterized protein Z518_09055 [Rhinocladiella mackenziei CBS 650.93]KIX01330.1 hypothetical protein Z518_09055 [Rhinocladiella mackenziei CBS 650.93]
MDDSSDSDKRRFETEFLPLMQSTLGALADDDGASSSNNLPIHVKSLGAEGQSFCDSMVNLMKQSHALLFAYDQLASQETQTSRLQEISTTFKRDKEVAKATIEAGRLVAGRDVDNLLADRFHEVRDPDDLTDEEIHKGRLL